MRKVYNQKNMSLTIDGVNIQDFHEGEIGRAHV